MEPTVAAPKVDEKQKLKEVFGGLDASGKVADASALQGGDWSGGGGGKTDGDGYDFM